MNSQEMTRFHETRLELVLNNKITESLKCENGILFHSIPHDLLKDKPINWDLDKEVNCPKRAFRRFSDIEIEYKTSKDGYIGATDREYTIWFDNGIIETFTSSIIQQTEIPHAPRVKFVQVETILMHTRNFMNAFLDTYEKCYRNTQPFSILISLIGIQNIFFNAREQNYTTTLPFPKQVLTFSIVESIDNDREKLWMSIWNIIHKTLIQFNAVR